jgi:hypothetical protein
MTITVSESLFIAAAYRQLDHFLATKPYEHLGLPIGHAKRDSAKLSLRENAWEEYGGPKHDVLVEIEAYFSASEEDSWEVPAIKRTMTVQFRADDIEVCSYDYSGVWA